MKSHKLLLTQYHFNRVGVETRHTTKNALSFLEAEYLLGKPNKTGWTVKGNPRSAKVYDSLGNLVAEATIETGDGRDKAMKYADPGYLADGKPRYELGNQEEVRAAWSYINHKANAKRYTARQRELIHERIQAAGRRYGIAYSHARTKTRWKVVRTPWKKDVADGFPWAVVDTQGHGYPGIATTKTEAVEAAKYLNAQHGWARTADRAARRRGER